MEIRNFSEEFFNEALGLASAEYEAERQVCPVLPSVDAKAGIEGMLWELIHHGHGKMALEDGRLIGYLAFFGPFDGMHGRVKGVFSPLGGNAFAGKDRTQTASRLFAAVSEELRRDEVFLYALSRYAHDEEVGRSFVMNAFGIRCSDAIMKLADRRINTEKQDNLTFKELKGEEKLVLKPLRAKLEQHLASAPCFFPTPLNAGEEWFQRDNIRVFAAEAGDEIAGYMAIDEEAETFITELPEMINICGAYVDEKFRGQKVAVNLLEYICSLCEKEKRVYLGVDCETMNPTALRFWAKYFTSYTYSYERRIDERIG